MFLQGIAEPLSGDEGTELVSIIKPRNTTMSYTPKTMNMEMSVGEPTRQMHNIEKTVQFGLLKNSSSQLDSVQLANRVPVKGCTEIKAAASQNGKYAYSNPTQVSPIITFIGWTLTKCYPHFYRLLFVHLSVLNKIYSLMRMAIHCQH